MEQHINPNLSHLVDAFTRKMSGAALEGSSRSGKTWSSIEFIIWLASVVETSSTINIIKETHRSFNTTLYEDFNRCFPRFGLTSPFADLKEVRNFKLYGNQINFLGADNESVLSGVGSDYTYYNEMLDLSKHVHDQTEQRCRKFWWGDWNPKATEHWVFNNICNRQDVAYLKTTFLDNPHISAAEKRKILSYEPTHPDDRGKPEATRRPHPTNIFAGTADDYMWNVYGLGIRSAPEGVVFQHVTWIKEFPKNLERIYYANDFGFTNSPTAFVQAGVDGKNLYLMKRHYEPTPSINEYLPMLDELPRNSEVVADPGDGGADMISAARAKGHRVLTANKYPGSIKAGISRLKGYKIHIVDCPEWRKEQANYKYRQIQGIKLDDPVDDFNHLWDAARYIAITYLRLL